MPHHAPARLVASPTWDDMTDTGLTTAETAAIKAVARGLPNGRWRAVVDRTEDEGLIAFLLAACGEEQTPADFALGRYDGVVGLYDSRRDATSRHASVAAALAEVQHRVSC